MSDGRVTGYIAATAIDASTLFDITFEISPAVFQSQKADLALVNSVLTANNLGNANLTADNATRTYTLFGDTDSEELIFKNNSGVNSLTINGAGDVYNRAFGNAAESTFFGFNTGRNNTGVKNTGFGEEALREIIAGTLNVAYGYKAGALTNALADNDGSTRSVYIGAETTSLSNVVDNEIAIGYSADGRGSNTAVIGTAATLNNYFFGDMNIAGLAGIGERNVVADATGLLKIGGTSDLVIHVASVGALPGPGATNVVYITDDTDFMYIWDDDTSTFKKVGDENIYAKNGILADNERTLNLKLDTNAAFLSFNNFSDNPIIKINGLRKLYLDAIKAPTGDSHFLTISDTGLVSSVDIPDLGVNLYNSDGALAGNRIVTLGSSLLTFSDNFVLIKSETKDVGIVANNPSDVNMASLYYDFIGDFGGLALRNSAGNNYLEARDGFLGIGDGSSVVAQTGTEVFRVKGISEMDGVVIFKSYTVATLPSVVSGGQIFVSDATGSSLTGSMCFSNGAVWIDVTTGIAVV